MLAVIELAPPVGGPPNTRLVRPLCGYRTLAETSRQPGPWRLSTTELAIEPDVGPPANRQTERAITSISTAVAAATVR